MTINFLLKNAKQMTDINSTLSTAIYKNKKIILKKGISVELVEKEKDLVKYLYNSGFITYELLEEKIENSEEYIIYNFLEGIDGFNTARDEMYYYNVGKLIGKLHLLFDKYCADVLHTKKYLIHGDLHSGNIIQTKDGFGIIDFTASTYDFQCIDLLNIGYEISLENKSKHKESAFISGYKEYKKISYPDKQYIFNKIMDSDEEEYLRKLKKHIVEDDYLKNLKKVIKSKEPSFTPSWCV